MARKQFAALQRVCCTATQAHEAGCLTTRFFLLFAAILDFLPSPAFQIILGAGLRPAWPRRRKAAWGGGGASRPKPFYLINARCRSSFCAEKRARTRFMGARRFCGIY